MIAFTIIFRLQNSICSINLCCMKSQVIKFSKKENGSQYGAGVCCSAAKLCLALCDPRDCSTPGSPGACSNSCPLRWWCRPTISSCVIPFCYSVVVQHTVQMTRVSEILKTSFREKTHPCHPRRRTVIRSFTGQRSGPWPHGLSPLLPCLQAQCPRGWGAEESLEEASPESQGGLSSRWHGDLASSQSSICPTVTIIAATDL